MHALIPFCTSIASPTFYQDFIEGLEDALAELGHSSERFEFREIGGLQQDELERFFAWARTARCDLVLDLCCWGFGLSHVRLWDGGEQVGATIFDSLGARYAALLYDQPFFQPLAGIESESLVICYPDRRHPEIIRGLYPSLRPSATVFAPPATRPKNERSPARWRDKRTELLYVGNLFPGATEPFWADAPNRRLYDGVAELIDASPEKPLHRCIEEARDSLGLALVREGVIEAHRTMEYFLRHRLRHRLVTAIAAAGLPLEVYGHGWDGIGLPANVRVHPQIDYRAYMDLIGDARLCLDASTYPGGANDRVFHFALNRTAFFSNAVEYLREVFGDDAGFYSPRDPAEAVEDIRRLLASPDELEHRSTRLREIALGGHLWRHRLEAILAATA